MPTVSNVLNRPDVVAPATRERVLAAIAELGFVRNESARQLRAGRSRVLAYVVLDASNPFFTDVAGGVEDAAREAGLVLYLCNSASDDSRERQYLELLHEQRVEGILDHAGRRGEPAVRRAGEPGNAGGPRRPRDAERIALLGGRRRRARR